MRNLNRRRFLTGAAAGGATAGFGFLPALAQSDYPVQPIRLLVPAPAGSRHGLSARLLAAALEKQIGQPVTVDHPEAPSAAVHEAIANAPADGYTLGLVTVDAAIMHWRGLTGVKPDSYTPLALFNEDPAGIHVRADAPWQDVKQLAAAVKAEPGKIKASSTPAGGIWHLSTVGWLQVQGLPVGAMPWVPATSPLAALEDQQLGGVDVIVCSIPEVRGTPFAKKTRTLAAMSRTRVPRFGDVPTLQQAMGLNHMAGAWRGIGAPKGLPPDRQAKLIAALKRTYDSPEFKTTMQRRGFGMVWSGGPDFAKFMEAQSQAMGRVVTAAGLAKA